MHCNLFKLLWSPHHITAEFAAHDAALEEEHHARVEEVKRAASETVGAAQNLEHTLHDLLQINQRIRRTHDIHWFNDGRRP